MQFPLTRAVFPKMQRSVCTVSMKMAYALSRKSFQYLDNFVIAQTGGNSDYVLVYELAEEHTHSFEWKIDREATETEDGIKHEECSCGKKRNENTVIPKVGVAEPDGLSVGAIAAIVIACVVVIAGGGFALWWFVFRKKKLI